MDFELEKIDKIDGAKIVKYDSFSDIRGEIWSTYTPELSKNLGYKFTHDKFSTSAANVLRGIHGDFSTTKIVTCITGEIKQLIVDLRPMSPTYGNHVLFTINPKNRKSIIIPHGCGNAFYTTINDTIYHYKLSYEGDYKDFDEQFTLSWDDKDLAIAWNLSDMPLLSRRDKLGETFESYTRKWKNTSIGTPR